MRRIVFLSIILLFLAFSCLPVRAINEAELIFVGFYTGSTINIGPLSPDTLYLIDLSYPNDTQSLGTPLVEIRPSFWNLTQAPMYSCNFEVLLSNPLRFVFYALSGDSYTIKVNGQFLSPPTLTVYQVVTTITGDPNLITENNNLRTESANLKTENGNLQLENANLRLENDNLKLNTNCLTLALIAISAIFIPSTLYLAAKSSRKRTGTSVGTDSGSSETLN